MASFEKRIDALINDLTQTIQLLNSSPDEGDDREEERNLQKSLQCLLRVMEDNEEALVPLSLLMTIQRLYFSCFRDEVNLSPDAAGSSLSLLTITNVEISTLWESVCYLVQIRVKNDMIQNQVSTLLEKQMFIKQLEFIIEIKGSNAWNFYEEVRRQKLYQIQEQSENLMLLLPQFRKLVELEMALVANEFFKSSRLSFEEFASPYFTALATFVENHILSPNSDNEVLRSAAVALTNFDSYVHSFESYFSNSSEDSPRLTCLRPWKNLFVEKGINNALLRDLNSKVLAFIKNTENTKLHTSAKDSRVLKCVVEIFNIVDLYHEIALDGFFESFSVIIKMAVVDFVTQHCVTRHDSSFNTMYLSLNSLNFSVCKLNSYGIDCDKIKESIRSLFDEIRGKHFGVLIRFRHNFEFSVLYLTKLWEKLHQVLTFNEITKFDIYLKVLRDFFIHAVSVSLRPSDILVLLSNTQELTSRYSSFNSDPNVQELQEIEKCCWTLLCRYAIHEAELQQLCTCIESTKNESNLVTSTWQTHINANTFDSSSYVSALTCSLQIHCSPPSVVVRPFIEQKYAMSLKILRQNEVYENQEFAYQFLQNLFTILILQESQPNALAVVLACVLEKQYGQLNKVLIPPIDAKEKPWWYIALEKTLGITVVDVVNTFLPSLLFEAYVAREEAPAEVQSVYRALKLEPFDESVLLENFADSLLSGISSVVVITPLPLLSSLQYLQSFMDKDVNFAFKSFAIHVILSTLYDFIKNFVALEFALDSSMDSFAEKLLSKMTDIAYDGETICLDRFEYIHRVLEEKTSRVNYIITNEINHIALLETALKCPEHLHVIEYFFQFLKHNQDWVASCMEDDSKSPMLNLGPFTNHVEAFNVNKSYDIICTNFEKAKKNIQWSKMISDVVTRLSNMSLSYLLSEREDVKYTDIEEAKKLRDMFAIKKGV